MTSTPRLITGEHYITRQRVTGWLIHKPNLDGYGADSLVPVTVLTGEGEKIRNVLIRVIDMLGVSARDFSRCTDRMLWRVAETDTGGLGEHALAELAYRERLALAEKERIDRARLDISRRSAELLKAGV